MEITANSLDWLSNDEQRLAAFLDTETGKRFIPKLVENAPPLLASGDSNAILIRSGELRGYQEVVRTILMLAHPAPPQQPQNPGYAAPEDDSAWDDGQKMLKAPAPENKNPEQK